MNCTLTIPQQKKLFKKVFLDLDKSPTPFNFKEYANTLYKQILDKTSDTELALSYVSLLPQNMRTAIGVDKALSKKFAPLFAELVQHETDFEDFDNVSRFVSPEIQEVTELKTIQEEVHAESLNPTKQQETISPILDEPVYTPLIHTFLSDLVNDKPENADRDKFYNDIKHSIVLAALTRTVETDRIKIPGVGSVNLSVMSSARIQDKHLRPEMRELFRIPETDRTEKQKQIIEAHKSGVALVLTDNFGDMLYLDDEGKWGNPEQGRPVYFSLRNPKLNAEGKVVIERYESGKDSPDIKSIKELAVRNKMSQEDAEAVVLRQLELIADIRKHISEDPEKNKVLMDIKGGGLGTPILDKKLSTPIAALNLVGQTFAPYMERNGMVYVQLKGFDTPIQIEKPTFQKELAEKLASLILDDLKVETGTGKRNIDPFERKQLFEQFVLTSVEGIAVYPSITGFDIKIFGKLLDVSDKNKVRELIVNFLTTLGPTREISKDKIRGRKVIQTTDPDYRNKYVLNTILETVKPQGSRYFVIEPSKFNTKKDLLAQDRYDDFDIVGDVVTKTPKSYVEFLKNNFVVFHPVDGKGNIQTVNSYLTFEPAAQQKVHKEATKAVVEKAKTEPKKDAGIAEGYKGEGSSGETTKSVADKLLNKYRKKLDKLIAQQGEAATVKQIEDAKTWYENHPLNEYFPFEAAFNAVNTERPNSIATWEMNGITLYKGADYSDLYHEAWHGFTQAFLSQEQKTSLYNEAKKLPGSFEDYNGKKVSFKNANDLQIEEFLAEDFRNYMLAGGNTRAGMPVRNNLFRRIWNFLKTLFGGSTVNQINIDTKANAEINSLYEKLRIGDLSEYTFAAENRNFNTLNKGVEKTNPQEVESSLNFENSKLLVDSIDSIFSSFADYLNEGLTDTQKLEKASLENKADKTSEENDRLQKLQGQQTYTFSTELFSSKEGLQDAYGWAQVRLAQVRNELAEKETITPDVQKKIDLLDWALRNFGDVENIDTNSPGKGIIGYHLSKSEYISPEIAEDLLETSQELAGKQVFDRGGNERSIQDLAAKEILYMLRGLHKTDINGKVELNNLGIPELMPVKETLAHIQRTVQDLSSPQLMYEALEKEGVVYAPIKALLKKLGPVSYPGQSRHEVTTWTKFWQTCNKHRIGIVLAYLDKVTKNESGDKYNEPRYTVNIGEANASYKQVGQRWESQFAEAYQNDFVKNDANGNYLDTEKVLKKYPDTASVKGHEFDFLNTIGIQLKNTKVLKDELEKSISSGNIKVDGIYAAITKLKAEGWKVRSIGNMVNPNSKLNLPGEAANYNKLQQLQARYSDEYSDFMKTNAEGDLQSEYSQNTTLTQKIKRINESKDIVNLTTPLPMSYLRAEGGHNPWSKASIWLGSLFDLKTNGGPKRKGVSMVVQNLGGVSVLNDGQSLNAGVQSASADEYTKLILDLHLQMRGTPELPRAADKKTSLSVWVNKLNTGATTPGLYVDTELFIKRGDAVEGFNKGIDLVIPYLIAEMRRVNECKRIAKESSGVEAYDWDFVKRGSDLVMFYDMLSSETKKALYSLDTDLESYLKTDAGSDLRVKIATDLGKYFDAKYVELKVKYNEAPYLSQQLLSSVKERASKAGLSGVLLTEPSLVDGVLRSFIFNNWIHNVEAGIFFYGDPALYNHDKEEYQKRIASANSTGDILRSDPDFLKYANTVLGRPYAALKGVDVSNQPYDGTINTAVVDDIEIPSVYKDIYKEAAGPIADKYEKVNEADAACLCTFDTYRYIREALGDWSDEQEELFQKIAKGEISDTAQIKTFFPVVKMGYQGEIVSGDNMPLSALHKFAICPLIPNVIAGTNLVELHEKMMRENIGYVTFKSGSKVATITKRNGPDKLYSDVQTRTLSKELFTPNTIFTEYLKDQIKITPKYKKKITFYTQLRSLISGGLMENGLPTDYKGTEEAWNKLSPKAKREESTRYRLHDNVLKNIDKLSQLKRQELLREVGGVVNKDGTITANQEKLMKLVSQELERRDLAEHERAFFQIGPDGKLTHDGSLSLSSEKVEKVLQAIVNKRLVRYNVNGEWLTQVSSAGFENLGFAYNGGERNITKQGTNDLPFYYKKEGKTAAAKCKISLQGDFMKLLSHPDVKRLVSDTNLKRDFTDWMTPLQALNQLLKDDVWLDKEENRRMVTIVAPRIPTQGLNSTEFAEVYEFLPTTGGPLIIMPTEITMKSGTDFDYDKLPVMMPNIQFRQGKPVPARQYTKAEARELYQSIEKANREIKLQDELLDKAGLVRSDMEKEDLSSYNNILNEIFGTDWDNLDAVVSENLGKEQKLPTVEEFFEQLNGAKSVENDILNDFKSILELPENFASLVKPNTTDTLQPIAEGLEDYVSQYNPKKNIFGETRLDKKGKAAMSGTRVFEYRYNLHKHNTNSVGKDTLGIAAVDNKYNVTANTIGLYLNPSYNAGKNVFRQTLLLPHNKRMVNGDEVISLSGLYDVEMKNYIGDIISEAINGLVDIAKGDWINYIQGNKELAPVLLFLFQAGVPARHAAVFLAQPIIREYVKEQKLAKSTFADVLGKGLANPMFFRVEAKKRILQNEKYGFPIEQLLNKEGNITNKKLNELTVNMTSQFKNAFGEKSLFSNIKNYAEERDAGVVHKFTDEERAAFLHFIEVEGMAKRVNDIKHKTNFDTSPPANLYEAQMRDRMMDELRASSTFPTTVANDMMTKTPIGSYDVAAVSQMFANGVFKLRVHPVLNSFIEDLLKRPTTAKEIEYTFGTGVDAPEKFVNELRNDLMSYIFQNAVRHFDTGVKEYKGAAINTATTTPIKEIKGLKFGAFVKEGVLFVDKDQIQSDYKNNTYSSDEYEEKGLAAININAFRLQSDYTHFVYERETLRSLYPAQKVKDNDAYVSVLLKNLGNPTNVREGESDDEFANRMRLKSYEEFLRNKALDNTLNPWKMFLSHQSYADQFVSLREKYPDLVTKYSVLRNLKFDKGKTGYRNLRISNNKPSKDTIELYHENLQDLANSSVVKVDNVDENNYISEFFARFPLVAFMQSGMNSKSVMSMNRIVPQDTFLRIMEKPAKDWVQDMNWNILQDYYNRFVAENTNKASRSRSKDYLSDMTLDSKEKVEPIGATEQELVDALTTKILAASEVENITVTDEEIREFMSKCLL